MKENMRVRGYFLKKRRVCIQNLTKESKQPPGVILQEVILATYLFLACGLDSSEDPI